MSDILNKNFAVNVATGSQVMRVCLEVTVSINSTTDSSVLPKSFAEYNDIVAQKAAERTPASYHLLSFRMRSL